MSAQNQCDQPHVQLNYWRNSPASVSTSSSEAPSNVASSNMGGDIATRHFISEAEALAFKSSMIPSHPSSSLRSGDTVPVPSILDSIDMPSNMVSFGSADAPHDLTLGQGVITDEEMARIVSVEREVCQNYSCCGTHLADFHALINHFESHHVSVVTPSGKRIFPPPRPAPVTTSASRNQSMNSPPSPSTSSTSSSSTPSRSPSVEWTPPPATPITPTSISLDPVSLPLPDLGLEYSSYSGLALSFESTENSIDRPCPYSYDVISAFGPEYDFTKDYACYEKAYTEVLERRRLEEQRVLNVSQAELQSVEPEQMDVQPATELVVPVISEPTTDVDTPPLSVNTSSSSSPSPSSPSPSSHDSDVLVDSLRNLPTQSLPKKSKACKERASTPNGGKVPKSKSKPSTAILTSNPMSSTARSLKREKNFKCPHRGCTKSYLNPNGLKYHLEKGTCKFDGAVINDTGFNSDVATSSPIEPKSSPQSSTHPASLSPPLSSSPSESSVNPPPASTLSMYGPFPSSMSPHEVYQTVMRAAALASTVASASAIASSQVSEIAIAESKPVVTAATLERAAPKILAEAAATTSRQAVQAQGQVSEASSSP